MTQPIATSGAGEFSPEVTAAAQVAAQAFTAVIIANAPQPMPPMPTNGEEVLTNSIF